LYKDRKIIGTNKNNRTREATSLDLSNFPLKILSNTHGKNGFAEISKNLSINLKIILINYQNNYVGKTAC